MEASPIRKRAVEEGGWRGGGGGRNGRCGAAKLGLDAAPKMEEGEWGGGEGGSGAAHAWQPQERGRGPAGDTDLDALGRAARGCSVLCVRSAEEERGKEMRLTCGSWEFKLNFRNLNYNQTCFHPKRTLLNSKILK
jgi:hypothetical protein